MKPLRVVIVLLTLAMAYLAQFLLAERSFSALLPDWLLQGFPALAGLSSIAPEEALELGLWMLAGAGVAFGLIAPLWDGEIDRRYGWRTHGQLNRHYLAFVVPILLVFSIGLAVAAAYSSTHGAVAALVWVGQWGAAVVLLLLAGTLLDKQVQVQQSEHRLTVLGQPERGWPMFVFVLCLIAGAIGYRWTEIPARIDPMTTLAGLAGQGVVYSADMLTGGEFGVSALAYVATAVAIWITDDGLAAVRWIGLLSGLLTVTGTWLLGCELFRRVPRFGRFGETVVDDGRWMAVLTAAIAGFSIVALHFGRLPVYFEGTALGVWSLWLLIRGTRRGRFVLIGLAGILGGMAVYVHVVGLLFIVLAMQWWIGIALFFHDGQAHLAARVPDADAETLRDESRPGKSTEFVYWVSAIVVAISLLVAFFVADSSAISRFWRVEYFLSGDIASLLGPGVAQAIAGFPAKLRETLLTINLYPDASVAFGYNAPFLHFWLSPLFVLAIGVTMVNIDSLLGWMLAGWLGIGFVAASLLAPDAPYWPLLVPVLPAIALATSLGIDRVRVLVVDSIGSWSVHATMYLALGAIVSAALFTWIGYYQFALLETDQVSVVARAIRQRGDVQNGYLVSYDTGVEQLLSEPVTVFVAAERVASVTQIIPGAWPAGIEDGAWFIVLPQDGFALADLIGQYPQGSLHVERNLRGDPLYYIYDVPGLDAL